MNWSFLDDIVLHSRYWDRDGNPIRPSVYMEHRLDEDYCRVGLWSDEAAEISTVWLGEDPAAADPPLIFETMATYGEPSSKLFFGWATLQEATQGHRELVEKTQRLGVQYLIDLATERRQACGRFLSKLRDAIERS